MGAPVHSDVDAENWPGGSQAPLGRTDPAVSAQVQQVQSPGHLSAGADLGTFPQRRRADRVRRHHTLRAGPRLHRHPALRRLGPSLLALATMQRTPGSCSRATSTLPTPSLLMSDSSRLPWSVRRSRSGATSSISDGLILLGFPDENSPAGHRRTHDHRGSARADVNTDGLVAQAEPCAAWDQGWDGATWISTA